MSDEATVLAGFDVRWHREIDDKVRDHDYTLRGNGEPGLKEQVRAIQAYVDDRVEREKRAADEERANHFQYKLAAWAGGLALAGLLFMSVLDHTVWKTGPPPPVALTTTTTTTDSVVVKKVKPQSATVTSSTSVGVPPISPQH